MFSSRDVDVLTQPGVRDGFKDLEATQDLDGVWGQGETVAATHIMRKRRGKEGESPELGISQRLHGLSDIQHLGSGTAHCSKRYKNNTQKTNKQINKNSITGINITYNQDHTLKSKCINT